MFALSSGRLFASLSIQKSQAIPSSSRLADSGRPNSSSAAFVATPSLKSRVL